MKELIKNAPDGMTPVLPSDVASLVDAPSSLEGEAALSALNDSLDNMVCTNKQRNNSPNK